MSTLSTTQSDSTTAEPDRNTPVTLDGDPVIWDGNPATLKGILEEVKLFYVREGLFQELFSDRAVLVGRYTAVESTFVVPFVKNVMSSHDQPYDFDDRCPSTAERIAQYDAKQAALAPPGAAFDRAAHAAVPAHFSSSIVVNPQVVKAEMRKLAKSLATIISNPARAHAMLEKTHYDGFEMLDELVRISKTAKDLDVCPETRIMHVAPRL